ncbi:MAG TPA: hypothetical protein VND65_20580 [Candidatus Binatia bacterium]|nr:hypothetical protein [Candidatus Binatia bacterium]
MRSKFSLAAVALTIGLICGVPAGIAQSAPHPFSYDAANETTISGTVSSVLARPAAGMLSGSHLLLTTASGLLDVSLGRYALAGKGALALSAGQQIEITGVMKTLNQQQVFLARTVKAGGQVFAVRNEHGIDIPPQAREGAARRNGGAQ